MTHSTSTTSVLHRLWHEVYYLPTRLLHRVRTLLRRL